MKRHVIAIVGIVVLAAGMYAQEDPQALMHRMRDRMLGARMYEADMRIKVDVPFLKAPESRARIRFEQPDKTHIDAPGFAMIPRQGVDLSGARLLSKPFTAVDAGRMPFQGTTMRKVKIIPTSDVDDIAVATIWVDTTMLVPRRVEMTTKKGGTVIAELVYDDAAARTYCLPSYLKLMVDVGDFALPKTMTGDFDTKAKSGPKGEQKATVEIWYSGYRINR